MDGVFDQLDKFNEYLRLTECQFPMMVTVSVSLKPRADKPCAVF